MLHLSRQVVIYQPLEEVDNLVLVRLEKAPGANTMRLHFKGRGHYTAPMSAITLIKNILEKLNHKHTLLRQAALIRVRANGSFKRHLSLKKPRKIGE